MDGWLKKDGLFTLSTIEKGGAQMDECSVIYTELNLWH